MKKILSSFLTLSICFISFLSFAIGEEEKENNAPTALMANVSSQPVTTIEVVTSLNKKKDLLVENNQKLSKVEKKEVLEKIKDLKEEVRQLKKTSADKKQSNGWDYKFKIGAILTLVAILFAIVGIGWVAGLAALVGLFFLIVGLLHTYN